MSLHNKVNDGPFSRNRLREANQFYKYCIVLHILFTACADIKARIIALIPLSFDWDIANMIQLWISAVLIDWYEHNYVHFRFHITVIADTYQGQDCCWLKFHWIRIYSKGFFFSISLLTHGAIYVLWAQDFVIMFHSFLY